MEPTTVAVTPMVPPLGTCPLATPIKARADIALVRRTLFIIVLNLLPSYKARLYPFRSFCRLVITFNLLGIRDRPGARPEGNKYVNQHGLVSAAGDNYPSRGLRDVMFNTPTTG